jgi:hypothetical protein
MQDTIEDQIALDMLDSKYVVGDIVQVGVKGGELTYRVLTETANL